MAIKQVNSAQAANLINNTGSAATKTEHAKTVAPAAQAYAKAAQQSAPKPADEAVNVQLSQRAKEMSQMKQILADTPDVREDKVAHFKDLIARGEYKPDAGEVADSILREAIKDELAKTPEIAL